MLDSSTKSRIDSARDILVGKVPDPKSQVEQITIALIYKFMDDMDRQSEEMGGKPTFFKGEFKKYRWADLLDKRLSGHERLELYRVGIERMNENKNIPQLFRDIFRGVFLPYRDPETLNLFLKEINNFTYGHSEELGNAYEYLLSVLGTQGDAGQFRTPRHIIDFIVSVVDPHKEDTVLDPACGTAGFLISAYKHILAAHNSRPLTPDERSRASNPLAPSDGERVRVRGTGVALTPDERARLMTNFCGYDIAPDMVRLSRVNMYLHGFQQPIIHEYDTLTSEERWDEPPLAEQEQLVAELEGYHKVIEAARQIVANYRPVIRTDPKWPTAELGSIADFKNGINYSKESKGTGIKVIGVSNFKDNLVAPTCGLDEINPKGIVSKDNVLQDGDILFVRSNGNRELVGRNLLVQTNNERLTHSAFTIRLRFTGKNVLPLFYALLFKNPAYHEQLMGRGANINNLSQDILSGMVVPLPPLSEQRALVAEIEAERTLVDSNRELIARFEKKMQARLAEIWGD